MLVFFEVHFMKEWKINVSGDQVYKLIKYLINVTNFEGKFLTRNLQYGKYNDTKYNDIEAIVIKFNCYCLVGIRQRILAYFGS